MEAPQDTPRGPVSFLSLAQQEQTQYKAGEFNVVVYLCISFIASPLIFNMHGSHCRKAASQAGMTLVTSSLGCYTTVFTG